MDRTYTDVSTGERVKQNITVIILRNMRHHAKICISIWILVAVIEVAYLSKKKIGEKYGSRILENWLFQLLLCD